VPLKVVHFLRNFVPNPEKTHLHRSGALTLNSVVCDTDGSGVVAMHRCFWLWMPHVSKRQTENYPCLAVVVEGTQFCLGGEGDNETQNIRADVESSIQLNGFAVTRHPT